MVREEREIMRERERNLAFFFLLFFLLGFFLRFSFRVLEELFDWLDRSDLNFVFPENKMQLRVGNGKMKKIKNKIKVQKIFLGQNRVS